MQLKHIGSILIGTATLGLGIPVQANQLTPLQDRILNSCSTTHVGDVIQNDVVSQSTSRVRDRFTKARVGAKVWGISAGGSGESKRHAMDQNDYSHDRSRSTPVLGQDCSTNVRAVAEIEINSQDNQTIRYGIDADVYKFERQLRRERINRMFSW